MEQTAKKEPADAAVNAGEMLREGQAGAVYYSEEDGGNAAI